MSGPFRKTDAVLTIAQDNARRAIEITAANEAACRLLGYDGEELMGKNFAEMLPERIAEMIEDYVEFEDAANDVGDVLRKVRDFELQTQAGKTKPVDLKVLRHTSVEHAEYLLVFYGSAQKEKADAVMKAARKLLEGKRAIDDATGLAKRDNFEQSVNVLLPQLEDVTNGACLAVCELDGYQKILAKHGIAMAHKAMREAGALCKLNLRGNDLVAQFDERRLAIVLTGATGDPAKMVLNRLRWLIASHKTRDDNVVVSSNATVWFRELTKETQGKDLFAAFEAAIEAKTDEQANTVIEI